MDDYESLKHTKWECKYPIVFIPKCRRKTLYQQLRQDLGEVFRRLAEQRESKILEGHLVADRGRQAEKLHGAALLGAWLLRVDGGSGRKRDPRIYPPTGRRGSSLGPTADVRLTAAAGGSPTIRFERFTFQASGFAGGIDCLIHRYLQPRVLSVFRRMTGARARVHQNGSSPGRKPYPASGDIFVWHPPGGESLHHKVG